MFKKTISEKLEEQEQTQKLKDTQEKEQYNKLCASIEKAITSQFNKAKKVLGDRLKFSKRHEGMYNFSFMISKYETEHWITGYIHTPSGNNFLNKDWKDIEWEFTLGSTQHQKLKKLNTKIELYQLSGHLIKWVELYLEKA